MNEIVEDFGHWIGLYRQHYPIEGTHALEEQGLSVIEHDFLHNESLNFVLGVCKWAEGRGPAIAARVKANNAPADIATALTSAITLAQVGDCGGAVYRLTALKGLGFSFASKVMRFLLPSQCVIFDSIIADNRRTLPNVVSYNLFLDDCVTVLNKLNQRNVRICDVEAAYFAFCRQEWHTEQL